jgi:hypothetical protein
MVTVHDPDYRAALQDFTTFTEQVSEKVVEADELIPELPVKDVVSRSASLPVPNSTLTMQIYRIYRGGSTNEHNGYFQADCSRCAVF